MDAAVTVSVGSIVAFVGFLLQVGLTIGAIAFSHGQLNQRVRAVEEKQKDHGTLATSVTRLETEMESVGREIKGLRDEVGREIKGLRDDLRIARNELRAEVRQRPQRGYTPPGWVEDERDEWGLRA